jgi:malonyl-CoA decarboxylase
MSDEEHGPADVGTWVDRRAELLTVVGLGGGDAAAAQVELDDLTDLLRPALDPAEATVRVVPPGEVNALATALLPREPVHPVADADLAAAVADRTDRDRRLVVLEHPRLPGRPLNVVWVALCRGVADSIDAVLDRDAPVTEPAAADTAVYWSIWNAEEGLTGLGGARQLIEGAVALLQDELPQLTTHATLSPVPGFRRWWEERRGMGDVTDAQDAAALARSCATYLTSLGPDGRPIDPVARFHLGNGASLWRINLDADRSGRGSDRSFGLMANYRYVPEDRAAHRAGLADGRIPRSSSVEALLTDGVGTGS